MKIKTIAVLFLAVLFAPTFAYADDFPVAVGEVATTTLFAVSTDFDASSSTDDVGIISYLWEFGDGATSTGETVSHVYTEYGIFDWTLTVSDDFLQTDIDTGSILVTVAPTGSFVADMASTTEAVYAVGYTLQLYLGILMLLLFGMMGFKFTRWFL